MALVHESCDLGVERPARSGWGSGADYDTIAFYAVTAARGARVVVPPAKTAKKASGYHRQARAENAFFRTSRSSAVLFELAVQEGRRLR